MTLPRVRRQERADDQAPAPTLSSDLWLPWRVTPLCVCSAAVHCTVNGLASGAPDPWGSPTGNLAPGASVSHSAPSTKLLQSPVASSPGFVVTPCSMADLAQPSWSFEATVALIHTQTQGITIGPVRSLPLRLVDSADADHPDDGTVFTDSSPSGLQGHLKPPLAAVIAAPERLIALYFPMPHGQYEGVAAATWTVHLHIRQSLRCDLVRGHWDGTTEANLSREAELDHL